MTKEEETKQNSTRLIMLVLSATEKVLHVSKRHAFLRLFSQ